MNTTAIYIGNNLTTANGCVPPDVWNASAEDANSTAEPCATTDPEKERLKSILSNVITVLIALVMIGIGCAVEMKKIRKHVKKPTGIVSGLLCQFVIMPVLGLAWAKIFKMAGPETLSLLIVGSCPGGTMSNIVAYWIGGDMELSTVMTTVSVVFSLGTLPLLLFIYSQLLVHSSVTVPYSTLGLTILVIVAPLSVGVFLRYKFPRAAVKVLKIFSGVGMLCLLILAAFSIYLFSEFWSFEIGQIVTAVFYPFCGMCLGYGLTSAVAVVAPSLRLSHSERRTVSVETGIQNSQLAATIVQLSGWSLQITGRVMVFPMMYAISQICWSILFILGYHLISLAKNGTCPVLSAEDNEVFNVGVPVIPAVILGFPDTHLVRLENMA